MKLFQWLMKRSSADGPGPEPRESDGRAAEPDVIVDPYNPFPHPVEIPLSDILDLHTIPPRDVKCVVEAYLEEAHTAGFSVVRIIHGKGIGVQRDMVRSILARTSFVNDWSDAPPEAGGLGATIVRFRAN